MNTSHSISAVVTVDGELCIEESCVCRRKDFPVNKGLRIASYLVNSNLQAWWNVALVAQPEGGAPLGIVTEVKDPARPILVIRVKGCPYDVCTCFFVKEAE